MTASGSVSQHAINEANRGVPDQTSYEETNQAHCDIPLGWVPAIPVHG